MIVTIQNIIPGVSYKVQFAGVDSAGTQTEWTNTYSLFPPGTSPNDAPTGGAFDYTTGNINVAWSPPVAGLKPDFSHYLVEVYTPADVLLGVYNVDRDEAFNFTLALNDSLFPTPVHNPRFRIYTVTTANARSAALTLNANYATMSGTFAAPTAEPVASGVNWKWSAPATNGDLVSYYEVDVDAGAVEPTFNETEAKIYGLNYLYVGSASAQYSVKLRATDVFGRTLLCTGFTTATSLAAGGTTDSTPPSGVTAGQITATTSPQPLSKFNIALDWSAHTPSETLLHYIVEWGTSTGVYTNSITIPGQAYTITAPRSSTPTFVRVRPVDKAGNVATTSTEKSVTAIVPPSGVPSAFNALWTTPTLKLTWTAPGVGTGLASDIVGYNVSLQGTDRTRVFFVTGTRFDFTPEVNYASKLQDATLYSASLISVSIKAVYDTGVESTQVNFGSATNTYPVNMATTTPTLTAGARYMLSSWFSVDDAYEYALYADPSDTTPDTQVWRGSALSAQFPVTGVATWYARIKAINILGTFSGFSTTSAGSAALVSDVTPPGSPGVAGALSSLASITDATEPSGGMSTLTATWTGASDSDVAGHKVQYAPNGTTDWSYVDVPQSGALGSVQTTTIRGFAAGSTYLVRVAAYDRDGNTSAFVSLTGSPKLLASDPTDPSTVGGLALTPGVRSLIAAWTASSDVDVKWGRGTYEVQLDTVNTFNSGNLKTIVVGGNAAAFTGLTTNTTYYCRVRAVDASGRTSAAYSTIQSALVPAAAAGDLGVTIGGGNQVRNASFEAWNVGVTLPDSWGKGSDVTLSRQAGRLYGFCARFNSSTVAGNTANARISTIAIPAVAVSTKVAISVWAKRVSGTGTFYAAIDSTGSTVFTPVVSNGVWARYTWVTTTGAASSNILNFSPGTVSEVWEVDDVQVEMGDMVTAYAPATDEILPNTVDLDFLNAGSILTKNLNIGDALGGGITVNGASGYVKSNDYDGTKGWRLSQTGLDIITGTIRAKALSVANSVNVLPVKVMDTFFNNLYWAKSSATHPDNPPIGAVTERCTLAVSAGQYIGSGYFGTSATDYNVPVQPNTQYTVSVYARTSTVASGVVGIGVTGSSGTVLVNSGTYTGVNSTWVRVTGVFTTGATDTAVLLSAAGGSYGEDLAPIVYLSGIQINKGATASTYSFPGASTFDGYGAITPAIRSTKTVVVNGVSTPAWALNDGGTAEFADIRIRGNAVVGSSKPDGTDSDGGLSYLQSANFVAGQAGWRVGSSGNAELNSATLRGSLTNGNANVNIFVGTTTWTDYSSTTYSNPGVYLNWSNPPTWSSATAYVYDDQPYVYVKYGSPTIYYKCLLDGTDKQPDLFPTYWQPVLDTSVQVGSIAWDDQSNEVRVVAANAYGYEAARLAVTASGYVTSYAPFGSRVDVYENSSYALMRANSDTTYGGFAGIQYHGTDSWAGLQHTYHNIYQGSSSGDPDWEYYWIRAYRYGIKSSNQVVTDSDYTSHTISATTSWAYGGATVGCVFEAPASGRVRVDWQASINGGDAGVVYSVGVELKDGTSVGTGTVISAATESRAIRAQGVDLVQAGTFMFFGGLTPGATYNVRMLCIANTAGGANWAVDGRFIMVTQATEAG